MYDKLLVALEQNGIPKEDFLVNMNVGDEFTEDEFRDMLNVDGSDLTIKELARIAKYANLSEEQAVEVFF